MIWVRSLANMDYYPTFLLQISRGKEAVTGGMQVYIAHKKLKVINVMD